MKFTFSKIHALLIGFLILLLTGQGLARDLVLCIGESGHAAFEQAIAGKCGPAESPCPSEAPEDFRSEADQGCGPCRDIPTSLDTLQGRFRVDQEISAPLSVPAQTTPWALLPPLPVRDLWGTLSPQPPHRPYSELLALRTTVLLI